MIAVLLYHHALSDRYGNKPEMLEEHFRYIAKNYQTVHPGELSENALSVCLTFDDAYYDFYAYAFPLLQKYGLKSVLAVPTALIEDTTNLSPKERLEKKSHCTWEEIDEMVTSPLLQLASHSHTHTNLKNGSDLHQEIVFSKERLESHAPVNTFVFPYGSFSPEALELANKHYKFVMRIGTAFNHSWDQRLLYRVPCDRLAKPSQPFQLLNRLLYQARYHLNQARSR
ncbi:MAG: polysaccharide deacetylase family protein [Chlamydiales bacterium]|nr:polysaccharide deacetylase family protein [Chlamydiales bacterium]